MFSSTASRVAHNQVRSTALFVNPHSGCSIELHPGRVVRTGSCFSQVCLDDGSQPVVRVPNDGVAGERPLQVNDQVWVLGPLEQRQSPYRAARFAIPASPGGQRRYRGVVQWVHAGNAYGQIACPAGINGQVFVHHSEFQTGHLQVGAPVTFRLAPSDRGNGEKAVDVHVE